MNLVPQFGFLELVLVAVVALIVVGPKDLPKLMRSAGRIVAKARKLAGEFTAAFDQMAREAEMEELRKEIEDLKKNNPVADAKRAVTETLAPIDRELRKEARDINEAARAAPVPDPAAPRPPQEAADEGAAVQSGQTLGEPAKS
jgi:sec-independent protein translocase protein TatB